MKYKVAVVVLAILVAVLIGDGYLKSRRAAQKTSTIRMEVSALSPQQLAVSGAECDAKPRGAPGHEPAYCAEVNRRLDTQPLQIVDLSKPQNAPPPTPAPPPRQ